MILDTIILENFGAYGGRQEACITPKEGKPIILFGGMNGGGKTTLLDAIQLAFYGSRARISNRGKLGYKEYLRESIHRGADPGEGASITIRFRRTMEGETRKFELQRYWREGVKGIEETVRILRDGLHDDIFTSNWDEAIEAYLPSSIAHLFFFDGEQIKELAEGGHAAEILGTAIHSLLGLDLVDRLETDLKVFERKKRAEGLDPETLRKLEQAKTELAEIDCEQEKTAMDAGALVNEAGRLGEKLRLKEEHFRAEGGELFLRRKELEDEFNNVKAQKTTLEGRLREMVAGPLPLLLVEKLLGEVEQIVRHESQIRQARVVRDVLESRDAEILQALKAARVESTPLRKLEEILHEDRQSRKGLADEPIILDAEDSLAPRIAHLRGDVFPAAAQESQELVAKIGVCDERIVRLESELERIPTEERIAEIQKEVDAARKAHLDKLAELEALRNRQEVLKRQRVAAEARLDKLGHHDIDTRLAEDDRQRTLRHSVKVRETLEKFRIKIVQGHITQMETLMLECFRKLLRKKDLIKTLHIDPETFEATLTGRDLKPLPFDRLSAGEKQLLATSLLWGLARASGRPVPTIIDTPLGRLDSSHRKHLVDKYFPEASHQVILLSTDEEIVGSYHKAIKQYITKCYLLQHDEREGRTSITEGYFSDETTGR